jgi:hypothetical protein
MFSTVSTAAGLGTDLNLRNILERLHSAVPLIFNHIVLLIRHGDTYGNAKLWKFTTPTNILQFAPKSSKSWQETAPPSMCEAEGSNKETQLGVADTIFFVLRLRVELAYLGKQFCISTISLMQVNNFIDVEKSDLVLRLLLSDRTPS